MNHRHYFIRASLRLYVMPLKSIQVQFKGMAMFLHAIKIVAGLSNQSRTLRMHTDNIRLAMNPMAVALDSQSSASVDKARIRLIKLMKFETFKSDMLILWPSSLFMYVIAQQSCPMYI